MIIEYHRPKTLNEAISLLQRKDCITQPLGGGTSLSQYNPKPFAVVDLQNLGLNEIKRENGKIEIGAAATLSEIESFLQEDVFTSVISIQAGKNLRNSGTIGGLVNVANGRSPLLTLLLALDAELVWEPKELSISLGNWLPQRKQWHQALLITKIILPDVKIVFDSVARSPMDQPIVAVAIAKLNSGRMRVAVGGFGEFPVLALDGDTRDNIEVAVELAFANSDDQWASAEYRKEAGKRISARLFSTVR